jgi:hypothetical protein
MNAFHCAGVTSRYHAPVGRGCRFETGVGHWAHQLGSHNCATRYTHEMHKDPIHENDFRFLPQISYRSNVPHLAENGALRRHARRSRATAPAPQLDAAMARRGAIQHRRASTVATVQCVSELSQPTDRKYAAAGCGVGDEWPDPRANPASAASRTPPALARRSALNSTKGSSRGSC